MSTKTKTKKKKKGGLPKWAIKQANGDFKKAWAIYKRKRGTKAKTKRKVKRATRKTKRTVRRAARRTGGAIVKRKAMSINILKTAALVASVGSLLMGKGTAQGTVYQSIRYKKWENVGPALVASMKQNWFGIFLIPVLAALAGRALGRYSPKAGIPGAISVKAF